MRNTNRTIIRILLLLTGAWPVFPALLPAQKKADTLAAMRHFVTLCNNYKSLPLQLVVQVQNSSNMVSRAEDTASMEAGFYMSDKGSYIRYGELEQVANDSIVLLVSKDAKRMLVYPGNTALASQLKRVTGFYLQDSSVQKLAAGFTVKSEEAQNGIAGITLQSRVMVYGTRLPKEEIAIRYNADSQQPESVIQTQRQFIAIDSSSYAVLQQRPEYSDKLVEADGAWYVVKEQRNAFHYRQVDHLPDVPLPVLVSDRIDRLPDGSYKPVAAYNDFILSHY